MTEPKLSEVFDSKTQLPWEPGVYKTNAIHGGKILRCYQYWNGEFWGMYSITPERAKMEKNNRSMYQQPIWQGIVK